jgi:hypothetical protein
MDDCECCIIDVHIVEGGRAVHKAKIFAEDISLSPFESVVTEAIQEYAQFTSTTDSSPTDANDDEEEDPIKLEMQSLMGRIVSVKCVGKSESAELIKFLQMRKVTLKMVNSNHTPIIHTGIIVQLGRVADRDAATTSQFLKIHPPVFRVPFLYFTHQNKILLGVSLSNICTTLRNISRRNLYPHT